MSSKTVNGIGPIPCKYLFLAEAPGWEEVRGGEPLIGKSGREFDWYCLPETGLQRSQIRIDNVYQYQLPKKDNDKKKVVKDTWEEQSRDALKRIRKVSPEVVVAIGGIAKDLFLPELSMEMVHGIPHKVLTPFPCIVIPCYHPAAGLHQTSQITHIRNDFIAVGKYLSGESDVWEQKIVFTDYKHWKGPTCRGFNVLSCDTETTCVGDVWSVQVSTSPGSGRMIWKTDESGLEWLRMRSMDTLWVFHNAPFDLMQLARVEVHPRNFVCTMDMAYLLGDEHQSLKTLGYRHLGIKMQEYLEMVAQATQDKADAFIREAEGLEWEQPPKTMKDGKPYQPQSVATKLKRLRTDQRKDTELDLHHRWKNIEDETTIERLGRLYKADLSDVDREKAIHYGCQDADVTLQIAGVLARRMMAEGLPFNKERYGKLLEI